MKRDLPQPLSHFEIVERIGAGGMGVVYRARDLKLDRFVAIKVLPDEFLRDAEFRDRFLREARTASALNHPNIVTIHEIDAHEDIDFIVMEYVEGRRLDEIIADGRLSIAHALDLSIQIAAGLAAAHREGIVHRDLKPSNIVVTEATGAKILDFGLAKKVWSTGPLGPAEATPVVGLPITRVGVVQGTPQYMSPEQASGENVDTRSDVFSFGCVLYEMLSGSRPFTGNTPTQLLASIIKDVPASLGERLPDIHPEIERIVAKAMQKNPADRYQSTVEMYEDLRAVRREIATGTTMPTERVAVHRAGNRRTLLMGAALAVLVASLLAVWIQRERQPSPPAAETLHRIPDLPGSVQEGVISPDGSMVAFVAEDSAGVPQIWVKNLAEGNPVQVTSGDEAAESPAWSPRNDQILFVRARSGVWSVPPLGGQPRRVLESGVEPNFDPDGARIVFEDQGRLSIADADGRGRRVIDGVGGSYFSAMVRRRPAFSPDGRFVAYFEPEDGPEGDIWIAPSEGGEPRRLTNDHSFGGEPVWTPDGRWIIYASDRAGAMNLWSVSPEDGSTHPVTTGAGEDRNPDISHDGKKLVYRNTRVTYSITLLDLSTGQRKVLVERPLPTGISSVSPTGDRLAFFGATDAGTHLFTQSIDGGAVSQITNKPGEENIVPFWSADGHYIYYYEHRPSPSFRRIPSSGGESTVLIPEWSWVTNNSTRIDAEGKRAVWSLLDSGRARETRVRNLESGTEIVLGKALNYPAWSPDQKSIAGFDNESQVFVCDVAGPECHFLTKGVRPEWSHDGSEIFFLRETEHSTDLELLVVNVDGTNVQTLATLDYIQQLVFGYAVTPDRRVVWSQYKPGQSELWWAQLQ